MSKTRQDKSRRHGARYRARRRAVDIIFEAEARDIDPVAIVEDRIELSQQPDPPVKPVTAYTQEIVGGVAVELDRVDEVISRYLLDNWMLERLPAVDRAILRVATWELLFNPDVPVKTAVVEGVELASEYSTDAAAPYINAALDSIANAVEDLRAENSAIQLADSVVVLDSDSDEAGAVGASGEDVDGAEVPRVARLRWL